MKAINYIIGLIVIIGLAGQYPAAAGILILLVIVFAFSGSSKKKKKTVAQSKSTRSKKQSKDIVEDIPVTIQISTNFSSSYSDDYAYSYDRDDSSLTWYGYRELKIANETIDKPFTYFSDTKKRTSEPSCINSKLKITNEGNIPSENLGYYPSYWGMSPSQRGFYISWLANGKKDQLDDIGYAFVYFYGLERRALIDKEDIKEVLLECVRLLDIYNDSGSFKNYCSRFITYLIARFDKQLDGIDTLNLLKKLHKLNRHENILNLILHKYYEKNMLLDADMAIAVAKESPNTINSIVFERVHGEFVQLFSKKYKEVHDDGLQLKISKRQYNVDYYPASSAIGRYSYHADSTIPSVKINFVNGIPSQFKKIVEIWNSCVEELRKLSSFVAKDGDTASAEYYAKLPDELKLEAEHPDKQKWEKYIQSKDSEYNYVQMQASEIAGLLNIEDRPKYTKKQCEQMVSTAKDLGYDIIPDLAYTGRVYAMSDILAISKSSPDLTTDRKGRLISAFAILELSMNVAIADGVIDELELRHINNFIEADLGLNGNELKVIDIYSELLKQSMPNYTSTINKLKQVLSSKQRQSVSNMIVGIASADGEISKKEIKVIKKIYNSFELSLDLLDETLMTYGFSAEPSESQQSSIKEMPVIDRSKVENIRKETIEIGHKLGEIFNEEEISFEEVETIDSNDQQISGDSIFEGLEERYWKVLQTVMSKESWLKDEFHSLLRENGFMPVGFMEDVNTWSEDSFGDLILEEDGNTISVNTNLSEVGV